MIILSESQEYYDDLLAKGYTSEDAFSYTKKYYPEFTLDDTPIVTLADNSVGALAEQEFNPYAPSPLTEKQEIIPQEVK